MKKLFFVFGILVALISCSKDEAIFGPEISDEELLKCTNGQVFKVYPGGDETTAIMQAFELAKLSGQGSVVKLMPGTYEIGMIEIREFFGTFMGSGVESTIVVNNQEIDPAEATNMNKIPALVRFVGGDVTVKEMTLSIAETPVFSNTAIALMLFTDYTSDFTPVRKMINVKLDHLTISGAPDNVWFEKWLPLYGVYFGVDFNTSDVTKPRAIVNADISNCHFDRSIYHISIYGCKNSNFNIGTKKRNLFGDSWMSITATDNVGNQVKISNNVFNNYGTDAIDITSGWGAPLEYVNGEAGVYQIYSNTINMANQHYGLGIFDAPYFVEPVNPRYMKFIVLNNVFYGEAASAMALFGAKKGLFAYNTINSRNNSQIGIDLYGTSWGLLPDDPLYPFTTLEDCRFINNRFNCPVLIYLGSDTEDNLFVGDLSNAEIWDEGVNNTFNDRPAGMHFKSAKDRVKTNAFPERIEKIKGLRAN